MAALRGQLPADYFAKQSPLLESSKATPALMAQLREINDVLRVSHPISNNRHAL